MSTFAAGPLLRTAGSAEPEQLSPREALTELPPLTLVVGRPGTGKTILLRWLARTRPDLELFAYDPAMPWISAEQVATRAPVFDDPTLYAATLAAGQPGGAPKWLIDNDAHWPLRSPQGQDPDGVSFAALQGFRALARDSGGVIVRALRSINQITGAGEWDQAADQFVFLGQFGDRYLPEWIPGYAGTPHIPGLHALVWRRRPWRVALVPLPPLPFGRIERTTS